jgi:hypothetical protein
MGFLLHPARRYSARAESDKFFSRSIYWFGRDGASGLMFALADPQLFFFAASIGRHFALDRMKREKVWLNH